LSAASESRSEYLIGSGIQICIGHNEHVILRAAGCLDALAVRRRGLIDVFGNSGRADETDGRDVGMRKQRIDRFVAAIDDVKDAFR
jgi:hypothetical protein